MLFQQILRRQENRFPEYFRQEWAKQQTGHLKDPVVICWVARLMLSFLMMSIIIGTTAIVNYQIIKNVQTYTGWAFTVWAMVYSVGAFALMVASDRLNDSVIEFEKKLATLGQYLGRTPQQLCQLSAVDRHTLAANSLKTLSKCLLAVQTVKGDQPTTEITKEAITDLFRTRYQSYAFWGLIEDKGWKQFFSE